MKVLIAITILLGAVTAVRAQVEPEATSPAKLAVSGTLTYSARAGQITELYSGTSGEMANVSGDFGYTSTSERHPTSIMLGAGDSWRIYGISYGSGPYENLAISQSLNGQHWLLSLRDSVSYRNGVGVTEPNPTSPNTAAEPIQTLNTAVLNQDASVQLGDKLSGSTTLSASGGYNQLEYIDGDGLDTNMLMATAELSRRLEARDSIFGEYAYAEYTYSTGGVTIDSNTAMAGWSRIWTRRISTTVSAGPQWLSFETNPPAPTFAGYSASGSLTYAPKLGTATLAFRHGVNGGGGYLYGSEVNDFTGTFTRRFGRNVRSQVTIALSGGYRSTDRLQSLQTIALPPGLGAQGDFTSKYGSAQASRHLGRLFSVYANYLGNDQSENSLNSSVLLNGLWQTITAGIAFTPPQIHLRQ